MADTLITPVTLGGTGEPTPTPPTLEPISNPGVPGEVTLQPPTPAPAPTPATPAPAPTDTPLPYSEGDIVSIEGADYVIKDGNAILKDGTIFKTKDELIALTQQPAQILIDGTTYTLDKDGNAVDASGSVFMTKDKIDSFSQTAATATISDIVSTVGFKPTTNGKEVAFDNTVEGITSYIQTYARYIEQQASQAATASLLEKYPDLPRIINHIEANGSISGFDFTVDPNSFKVSADNEDSIKNAILHGLSLRGVDAETATSIYDAKKKDGKALEYAKQQESYISKHYADIDAANQSEISSRQREEIETSNNYWGVTVDESGTYTPNHKPDSVYTKIVKDGRISVNGESFVIPNNITINNNGKVETLDRAELFEFMFIPEEIKLDDGTSVFYTPFEILKYQAESKRTVDHDILEAFKLLTGSASQLVASTNTKKTLDVAKTRSISTKGGNAPPAKVELITPVTIKTTNLQS